MQSVRVTAIVPAAGSGTRMRQPGEPSKQFRALGGAPLLVQTLRIFERSPLISDVIVVAPAGEATRLARDLAGYDLAKANTIVNGGSTRQGSVRRGLDAIEGSVDLVLVHDGVRPFLSENRLAAVVRVASASGAAALAIPVADTLRYGIDGIFGASVPRTNMWRMQTPQAFKRELLRQAHDTFAADEASDDVELVQRLGVQVQLVEGSTANFKITTPADWKLAEALWSSWSAGE